MLLQPYELIDISQPIDEHTACFSGDTPFSSQRLLSYEATQAYNLTRFSMSPHVGTHADAPAHITPSMDSNSCMGAQPLMPFIGPCMLLDIAPCDGKIELEMLYSKLAGKKLLPRLLFRTRTAPMSNCFPQQAAYLSCESIAFLAEQKVLLIGLDSPSVDPIQAKTLMAHNLLLEKSIFWLENLELSHVLPGSYWLVAPPVKLMTLEAAPVRAVLISFSREVVC